MLSNLCLFPVLLKHSLAIDGGPTLLYDVTTPSQPRLDRNATFVSARSKVFVKTCPNLLDIY
jgi:hypothetical protein